mmetsp:Transcript_76304/g.202436  ORF Transcript_76304/g.202436 Transcript_76304/m.202436 type:complete len:294 (+) Transcript_76304:1875-2756(+)
MGDHLDGAQTLLLLLLQHLLDKLLARRVDALRDLHLFGADVRLVPKREAASGEPVHDDAHGPHVHFLGVVLVEELRRPEDLRADGGAEAFVPFDSAHRAEVREHDFAARLDYVLSVHEVVVSLDVAVDALPAVQVLDALAHLPRHVYHTLGGDLALVLQVPLQALHEVPSRELVHDDAHEAPLVVDAMALDDVGVVHALEHRRLLLNRVHGRLNLVHHFDGEFLPSGALLAVGDDPESAFAERLADGVLLQQPHVAACGSRRSFDTEARLQAAAVALRGVPGRRKKQKSRSLA